MRPQQLFFRIGVLVLMVLSNLQLDAQKEIIENGNDIYLANTIIVKLKDGVGRISSDAVILPKNIEDNFQSIGMVKASRKFLPKDFNSKSGKELQRIISINFSAPYDPKFIASKISQLEGIEWAEPHYVDRLVFDPNDPSYPSQYNLSKIEASLAWDINQGDPSIIIAINDTGVDWDHPDLAANVWQNDDLINGIDDDGNGYIDDIRGWDFGGLNGTPDNNPMEDRPDHGTHVAGIVSAATNNGVGIAAIGFNCTIMPVKTSRDDVRTTSGQALISYGYEGMIYAVDNGAKVINCSWGSFSYSIASQEVINYVVEQGALVVGAAGNDNLPDVIYPGGYNGALSVGSTDQSDHRSGFSNYGKDVEVMAPGSSIYATWQNDTYTFLSGTSMASPLTAGLAGLVFNQFTSFTPLQIAEQIRVNCDSIDHLHSGLDNLLGRGRINAYKSLSNTNAVSVRAVDIEFFDEGDGDGIFEEGEDVSIEIEFTNYLSPTSSLSVILENHSPYVSLNNNNYAAGAIPTLGTFNNNSNKFTLTINQSIPENAEIDLLIKFLDGNYDDFQWISFLANPTYRTQAGNKIALTITSKGALAFNDYPNNLQGEGYKYDAGPNLTYEGALLYGTDANHVMDAARGSNQSIQSTDFSVVQPFILKIPGTISDQQGISIFNDDGAGGSKLDIETELTSYSFADEPDDKYIILQYNLENNSGSQIDNLFVGLYFDWDIDDSDYEDNLASYDVVDNFGYAYNQDGDPVDTHVGVALISSNNFGYYAIDNDGSNGSISIYDGFTDQEKWDMISNGISRSDAGPNDISNITSGGPFSLNTGEKITVAFSIAAAPNLEELRAAIQQSRIKYNSIITAVENSDLEPPIKFTLNQNYPNPFNPETVISFTLPENSFVKLVVYDILGHKVKELVNEDLDAGYHQVDFDARLPARQGSSREGNAHSSGIYFYRIEAGKNTSAKKMILLK